MNTGPRHVLPGPVSLSEPIVWVERTARETNEISFDAKVYRHDLIPLNSNNL
jgi:hypothetical protein